MQTDQLQQDDEEREQLKIAVLRRVDRHLSTTGDVLFLCHQLGINPAELTRGG